MYWRTYHKRISSVCGVGASVYQHGRASAVACVTSLLVLAGAMALVVAGCGSKQVVRVYDGEPVRERYIKPDAYRLFMRAMMAEQAGSFELAHKLYLQAQDEDPDSVQIATRIAAVRCKLSNTDSSEVEMLFADAERLDPTYVVLWNERARCSLARVDAKPAQIYAETALRYAPYDMDATMLLVEALRAQGLVKQALMALHARSLMDASPRAWQALRQYAVAHYDEPFAQLASSKLEGLQYGQYRQGVMLAVGGGLPDALQRVDDAIYNGDLPGARQWATVARVRASDVAARAAAMGKWAIAREQARLVLSAEPSNPDALALLLVSPVPEPTGSSADLDLWRRAIGAATSSTKPRAISYLVALVFADGLSRRFGPRVARDWWQAAKPSIDMDPAGSGRIDGPTAGPNTQTKSPRADHLVRVLAERLSYVTAGITADIEPPSSQDSQSGASESANGVPSDDAPDQTETK